MHDLLEALDRLFGVFAFHENDHVAGLPIGRDQQPAPERAFDSVVKTFWSFGQALDRADPADGVGALREFLDSTQISLRGNIARRDGQNHFWLRRKTSLDLFGLLDPGIAGGKEKILI